MQRNEFAVLVEIERNGKALTRRELAARTGLSAATAGRIIANLTAEGYVSDMRITDAGLDALEPYRVRRAIFVAAGFGSRLIPITFNTPKPLVRVWGKRMIEYLLDAVVEAGIEEIIVVRGYLAEQFDALLKKYPNIKFVENGIYNESNNISSLYLVREHLSSAYIFESDLVLTNRSLITKYQYSTNYLGIPTEKSDDWCLHTVGRRVRKMTLGGTDCYQMVGISYWTEEDGKRLGRDVAEAFHAPGGKDRFWDQIPLDFCQKRYNVEVRPCRFEDVTEIDNFNELKRIDKTYDCV